jgi:hypothetical protein
MEQVKISVKPVREVVLVELYAGNVSARAFQLVYDDVFARLDQLIDAGMACWINHGRIISWLRRSAMCPRSNWLPR